MLRFVSPFERLWANYPLRERAARSLARFFRDRFGAEILVDSNRIPLGNDDLFDVLSITETLREAGVVQRYGSLASRADEPQLVHFRVDCADASHSTASGLSLDNERDAITAATAEALERYLWRNEEDYFRGTRVCSHHAITELRAMPPDRFVGLPAGARYRAEPDAEYLWIEGHSWISDSTIYIPAQTVSGSYGARRPKKEPMIREPVTTGLATWPTKEGAVIRGALEIIERDAFMLMWLNQLTLPRIDLSVHAQTHPSLARLLENVARYGLKIDVVRLMTDAPAYAVCAFVTDQGTHIPRITVGLKAHRDLATAAEHAILEALRGRVIARNRIDTLEKPFRFQTPLEHIGHFDRVLYWCEGDRYEEMQHLASGPLRTHAKESWDNEPDEKYLRRLIEWCRERGYEMASVPLGDSPMNRTAWSVEMVVIPEMQPMHLHEKNRYTEGARISAVPKAYGFTPSPTPFIEAPHPFV